MKRKLTPEQEAARAERKARFRAIVKQLADMTDQERAQLTIRAGAVVTVEGRALSLANTMLLLLQIPRVSCVGGFRQWLAAGRCVRKGEHGACIWIPRIKAAKGESGEPSTQDFAQVDKADLRFLTGTVFDISQTEALDAQPAQEREAA